jgi:DNA-binding CsgD family transcriptional regulator
MTSERARSRCRERLERLGTSSLDRESIQRETIAELRKTIGFDRWCWPLGDPETLLPLSGLAEHDYGPRLARALELEFSGNDFAAKHLVARHPNHAAAMSRETDNDLARSPRWDEVMRPVGIGDIATVACRDGHGCWGWIEAYRDSDDRRFDTDELALLAASGRTIGSVLRRGWIIGGAGEAFAAAAPGVLVLDRDLRVVSRTKASLAYIDALPAAAMFATWGMLPAVVYPVAMMARSFEGAKDAHALERSVDGRWLMIEAAPLEGEEQTTAVTIRRATAAEAFARLCRIYALTQREREIASAVIEGLDTRGVSDRLFISAHTVQDHLKSIFEKVGVRSRRELVAIFNKHDHVAASGPAEQTRRALQRR